MIKFKVALSCLLLTLSACGGGGGGSDKTPTYTEMVTSNPADGGSITGTGTYKENTDVTLTATPNTGYTFTNWTEGGTQVSSSMTYSYMATEDRSLVANFVTNSYSISASASPTTAASIVGSRSYDYGASVTLTANGNIEYLFLNWTENGVVVSTLPTYSSTAETDRTLVANFVQKTELFKGRYDGVMKSPSALFGSDQAYTTFEVSGADVTITQEHFFGETCVFTGQFSVLTSPMSASGTYECSDFTSGMWSSQKIAKMTYDSVIVELEIDTGAVTYLSNFVGFLPEGGIPNYYATDSFYRLDSGNYLDLNGAYKGKLKGMGACSGHAFETPSSDTAISISGSSIVITQDSFQEGTCVFTGQIDDISALPLIASGTYECSNFDEGTWQTSNLALTSTNSFIATLSINVPDRGCDYVVSYTGFETYQVSVDLGPDQNVALGDTTELMALGYSDDINANLEYAWTIDSVPVGSGFTASLSDPMSPLTSFTPNFNGEYVFTVTVTDSYGANVQDQVVVNVRNEIEWLQAKLLIANSNFSGNSCGIFGNLGLSGYIWNFNNCYVYGDAGNPMKAVIINHRTNDHYYIKRLTGESCFNESCGTISGFQGTGNIAPTSQFLAPAGSYLSFSMSLSPLGPQIVGSQLSFEVYNSDDVFIGMVTDSFTTELEADIY